MDPLIQAMFMVIGAALTAAGLFMRRSEARTAEVDKLESHIEKQIDKVVAGLDLVREEIGKIKQTCGANHPEVNRRLDELGVTATRLVEVERRLAIVETHQRPSIIVPRSGG